MPHWKNGLYFERTLNGGVRIVKQVNENRNSDYLIDEIIDPDGWAEIVAAVSQFGVNKEAFQRALILHGGLSTGEVGTKV